MLNRSYFRVNSRLSQKGFANFSGTEIIGIFFFSYFKILGFLLV